MFWEQVDTKYISVDVVNFCKMFEKSWLIVLVIAVELYLGVYSWLFPEGWYWTSDLHMGKKKSSCYYYLLSLAEIGCVALILNSSGVVASSAQPPSSPRYQIVLHLLALDIHLEVLDRALQQPDEPSFVL